MLPVTVLFDDLAKSYWVVKKKYKTGLSAGQRIFC
jgi:hypothetical protein